MQDFEIANEVINKAIQNSSYITVLISSGVFIIYTLIIRLVDYFKAKDYEAVPAVLCKNHGPFTWGKDGMEAVHNAVVLEEVAKMACRCELINPQVKPAPQELQDKHYYRKHGANAYYGQIKK